MFLLMDGHGYFLFNKFRNIIPLSSKVKKSMEAALLSSGIVADLSEIYNISYYEQDFYFKAACVLSYMDNTSPSSKGQILDWTYASLLPANSKKWNDWSTGTIEIRYIPANDCN